MQRNCISELVKAQQMSQEFKVYATHRAVNVAFAL